MKLRLVVGLVALLASACTSADRGGAHSGSLPAFASVAMVGDSITEGSVDALREAFEANGYTDVRIAGEGGRRIAVGDGNSRPLNGVSEIQGLLDAGVEADVWVVELGTNDLGKYTSPEEYRGLIDHVLGVLPEDAPIVWVNTYWRDELDDSRLFNTVLGQRLSERGNAVVADWYTVVSAPGQDLLVDDGVHPNDDGTRALALMVFEAISRL